VLGVEHGVVIERIQLDEGRPAALRTLPEALPGL
jgi:hypothetical protein